ncbi:Hypothetical protein NTJ_10393 [Nesidiocoris tenuis]|uniref:Uncharacterized protein n=1 Tax=Nesidiocoris tenuis TaxID=355587 RepID=A0ABN7B1A6_9HEMI|nr:Hypothetical protein NTJ_10393 [Nesidiocoris tenuis]
MLTVFNYIKTAFGIGSRAEKPFLEFKQSNEPDVSPTIHDDFLNPDLPLVMISSDMKAFLLDAVTGIEDTFETIYGIVEIMEQSGSWLITNEDGSDLQRSNKPHPRSKYLKNCHDSNRRPSSI